MNWRKSVFTKKAVRYGFGAIRKPYKLFLPGNNYHDRPPILANSFPKSGTHLLIQILQTIPAIRDWGLFLATTPSFVFSEVSDGKMIKKIKSTVPDELISAHLFYSEQIANALMQKNIIHFFIYRDPRDVVISEAHYLTYMNNWHKLHKYFKALPDMEARILFSIQGATDPFFPHDYPDIGKRFDRYKPWKDHPQVFSLRFEELIGQATEGTVRRIIRFYNRKSGKDLDQEGMVQNALANINPNKSHTFRKGKSSAWKDAFTKEHKEAFKNYAGNLLVDLGYEQDHSW
jgi:hypothetical protein